MAFSDEQLTTMRQKLGIAEDADEATILAALDEALDERSDPPAQPTAGVEVPEGMTIVSTEVLDELRTGAQAGREAQTALRNADRDRTIEAAVRAGKITAAQRGHFSTLYDADPDGTRTLLDGLAAGLVPVSEIGHDNPTDEMTSEEDAAYAAVFPEDVKKGA